MPLFETKIIQLPDGQATIKELSVGELKEADEKGTESAVKLMKALPEKIVESELARQRDIAMERIIRYEGYDPETLVRHGLIAWSYSEPCDAEHKAVLSAKKGEIIARAIFELSVLESGEAGRSSPQLDEGKSQGDLAEPTTSI